MDLHPLYLRLYGKHGTIYSVICLHKYHSELAGDVRAPLLRVVPVKLRYGDTCVIYEQPQFLPLCRSNIQTVEIDIKSDR